MSPLFFLLLHHLPQTREPLSERSNEVFPECSSPAPFTIFQCQQLQKPWGSRISTEDGKRVQFSWATLLYFGKRFMDLLELFTEILHRKQVLKYLKEVLNSNWSRNPNVNPVVRTETMIRNSAGFILTSWFLKHHQEDLAHHRPKMVAFLISCSQGKQSTSQWRTPPPKEFRVSHTQQSQVAAEDSPELHGGKVQAKHSLLY